MHVSRLCAVLTVVVSLVECCALSSETVVYRGAKILTAAEETYEPGTLVVADGKIQSIGPAEQVAIPEGARIVDLTGKVVIPGLIDTHSHLGLNSRPRVRGNSDGNESTGPVQAIVRALDAINPFDPGFKMALAGGVTTANVMPGSGNVIGGQTVYVKLRGYTPEQMWIASDEVYGGLKMANGENPKRSYGRRGKAPGTRMKVAALQRAAFLKAQQYMRKWDDYRKKLAAGDDAGPPDVDISLEPLVEVLQGKRTVHFHTHRADDILTVLRLKQEFKFDLLIQHGTESYKVYDEIAKLNVPVSMTIIDSPGGKAEVVDLIEECGAELAAAGIKVLVNTDDPITPSRFFLRTTAIAVRGGLSEDLALKSITLHPAQVMRLDDRIGTLEQGKDADFVVLSGGPFSVYTRVLQTFIDGKQMFDLADEKQRLYQTGGFAVSDRSQVPEYPPAEALPDASAPATPAGSPEASSESGELLILAGRLHTVSGKTMEQAAVHVRDGKIEAVGPIADVVVPDGTPVVTAAVVTPGLIDAHSVVPLNGEYNIPADQDADERSDPNQADVRVLDGFNPAEPLMRFLLEQGVTVVHACPGRANVIAGTTGVFRTHGRTAESMTVRFPHALLFNLGNYPKLTYEGRPPGTRMGTAAIIRKAFTQAANYRRKREKADTTPRDLKLEALSAALDGKIATMFCAQQANDLTTALRLIGEFKLKGQLALAADGYLIADQIAGAKVPVVMHPALQRIGSLETYNTFMGNGAVLADADVLLAMGSGFEGYVPKTRVIRHEAAMAAVYGLGFDRALKAITLDAAKILGIDDRFGSIEQGKAADLVLYDGDPFEHATHTTHVVVDGRLVYERAKRERIPLAHRAMLYSPEIPCCLEF